MKLKLIGNVTKATRILRSAQDDKSKLKLVGILAVTAVIAAVTMLGLGNIASAQDGTPPEIKVIIYQGNVTVAGEPAPDGLEITARIGNDYESDAAIIGAASPGRYTSLVVGNRNDLVGQTVQFWLGGQILAEQTDVLAPRTSSGQPCPGCSWTLPLTRTLDLSFPSAPVATPTPTLTPIPTPVVVQPSYYEGRVVASGVPSVNGYLIYARVGDYQSDPVTIADGRFGLVVDPGTDSYVGQTVQFFIGESPAVQTVMFESGAFRDDLNLVFTVVPTPTPAPTQTQEATRTATPAASATPTVTPTATPTLSPNDAATATAEAIGDEAGGGFCSANSGGPASVGILGLFLAPIGLLVARRLRQARNV